MPDEITLSIKPEVITKILKLTKSFEGGSLVGDFDGALLSFGELQYNHGSRTLRPFLKDLMDASPEAREIVGGELVQCLSTDAVFESFIKRVMLDPGSKHPNGGLKVKQAWINTFQQLYSVPQWDAVSHRHASPYIERAAANARALGFHSERGLALCMDITTQNGDIRWDHFKLYRSRLKPTDDREWERLKVLAHVIAECANPQWYKDVLSRKLTIALGGTHNSGLKVHGRDVDIGEQFGISYWHTWYELPERYPLPIR